MCLLQSSEHLVLYASSCPSLPALRTLQVFLPKKRSVKKIQQLRKPPNPDLSTSGTGSALHPQQAPRVTQLTLRTPLQQPWEVFSAPFHLVFTERSCAWLGTLSLARPHSGAPLDHWSYIGCYKMLMYLHRTTFSSQELKGSGSQSEHRLDIS